MRYSIPGAIVVMLLNVLPAPGQERRGPVFELLKRLDRDGDGRISASEFPRGEERFRALDRDGDGFLTEKDATRRGDRGGDAGAKNPEPGRKEAQPPAGPPAAGAAPTADQIAFFESKIRPVLAESCYSCHATRATRLKGGLLLDSKDALLRGGNSGPAIVPGDADASLLVQALRYETVEMPPKGKLPEAVIRDFEAWVAMGAPDPRTETLAPAGGGGDGAGADAEAKAYLATWKRGIDIAEGRKFWSFQPPVKPAEPPVRDAQWPAGSIDRFVLAEMEERGLDPSGEADRRTLIRRVTFDLTGLPPSPEEIEAFEKDRSPDAFEKVVDRLLASPRYGERWGRHWLDVARYAESAGKESNIAYPHAWRYRDWVIASVNADKPYDEFLKAQVAGDLLPAKDAAERADNLVATGFLALGAKSHNARNRQQFAMDVADEQIDATTQAMLGLTVSCARCHDHKFDPIPTEDYYALAGIFLSTETLYGTFRGQGNLHPAKLIPLPADAPVPDGPAMAQGQRAVTEEIRRRSERVAEGGSAGPGAAGATPRPGANDQVNRVRQRFARDQAAALRNLLDRYDDLGNALPSNRQAMGVQEATRARDARVLVRGEIDKPAETVSRGFVQVLCADGTPKIGRGSGRRELAEWIASPANPLTARVIVNRIWLHLFGAGIVATPDNFGKNGQPPTHPELLDWLAATFVEDGWSVKSLIRRMVLSRGYRQGSDHDPKDAAVDPDGTWLWRMPKRRLEGEAIRDAMHAAAGTLDLTPPPGSPVGTVEGQLRAEPLARYVAAGGPVRSVYLPVMRDRIPEALDLFDFAEPSFVTGDREETNVATQALYLMNNEEVRKLADAMAGRLLAARGSDDERITRAFELCFGRRPADGEREAARGFFRDFPAALAAGKGKAPRAGGESLRDRLRDRFRGREAEPMRNQDPKRASWAAFCQALFQSAEFRYVD